MDSPPFYSLELENYELNVLGSKFKQYIPTLHYFQSGDEQTKRLEYWSFGTGKNSPPETMMAYELFTNTIYPHDKLISIENDLNHKLQYSKQSFKEENMENQFITHRMTLTGRSGDGKTFFLHRLADTNENCIDTNENCIVLPLHARSAGLAFENWIVRKLKTRPRMDGTELSNEIVKGCEEVLISYLVELEKMIDMKCGGLEIMYRFNNNFIAKVRENVETNNLNNSLSNLGKRIFKKTGKVVLLVLDEAHIFLNGKIIRKDKPNGSLLTAVIKSATNLSILCCSTMISGVNQEIEISDHTQDCVTQYFLPTLFGTTQNEDLSTINRDISIYCKTPSMFIEQFMNIFENDLQRQHIDMLLSSSSVRFCTMIMDEYLKLCICCKKKNNELSKLDLLVQTIRNVFLKRMPNYESKVFGESILNDQLRNNLEFIWSGLIPDIEGNHISINKEDEQNLMNASSFSEFSNETNLKIGVANTLCIPSLSKEQHQILYQHLLSIGCGSVDHSTPIQYHFSDPFFRFVVFSGLFEYENNLTKSLKEFKGNKTRVPLYCLDSMKGFYFERMVALLLMKIAVFLNGQPITKTKLFAQFRGTWLDGFTLRARSVEHDGKFASALIGMDLSDLIVTSPNEAGCDLFVSLIRIQDSNTSSNIDISPSLSGYPKIPCLIEIERIGNPKLRDAQKHSDENFMDLLKYSNHCENRSLRIVFNYRYSTQQENDVKFQSEDDSQMSAIFSLLDENVESFIDSFLDSDLKNTLYDVLEISRND